VFVPWCQIFDWDVIQNTTKIGTGKYLRVSLKNALFISLLMLSQNSQPRTPRKLDLLVC